MFRVLGPQAVYNISLREKLLAHYENKNKICRQKITLNVDLSLNLSFGVERLLMELFILLSSVL